MSEQVVTGWIFTLERAPIRGQRKASNFPMSTKDSSMKRWALLSLRKDRLASGKYLITVKVVLRLGYLFSALKKYAVSLDAFQVATGHDVFNHHVHKIVTDCFGAQNRRSPLRVSEPHSWSSVSDYSKLRSLHPLTIFSSPM